MGMFGLEMVFEEFICCVLGYLVQEGVVVKIVDDLYCGGYIFEEFLNNWERVFIVLYKCSFNLLVLKIIIVFKDVIIFGWYWYFGMI